MSKSLDRLVAIMTTLRGPKGCPWDIKQTFKTIAPHTLEEAYEVVETIENDDMPALREELGDLLLQVVFHAQMAREKALFDFDAIADGAADKLIERHPHVFGDRKNVKTPKDVLKNWEADKAAKRDKKAKAENRAVSVLDGLSPALPSTRRALKLSQRLARVGFDWPSAEDVLKKLHEEIDELEAEIAAALSKDAIEDELGDVMFALVNLARKHDVDPEAALRRCVRKVERRFRGIEARLEAKGRKLKGSSLDEMEKLWCAVKKSEKAKKK